MTGSEGVAAFLHGLLHPPKLGGLAWPVSMTAATSAVLVKAGET